MTTLVYRYGIAAPHDGADLVLDQMHLAHAYELDLVLIERGRRAAEREVRRASSEALRALEDSVRSAETRCEALGAVILATRKAARKNSETKTDRAELVAARDEAKRLRSQLYELRRSLQAQCAECRREKGEEIPCPHATPEARTLRATLDTIEARAGELRRNARAYSGLYWGTYLIVEKACRASFAAPLYGRDGVTPNDPRLPPWRWDGTGAVAVQIQRTRPLDVAGALAGKDARLQITPSPWPEEWLAQRPSVADVGTPYARPPGVTPDGRIASPMRADGTPARWVSDRAAREGELRMRVGLDEGMAAWRLDYHRSLPQGASITWCEVHRRMRGPHPEWSACITVDRASATAPASRHVVDVLAIDVGWRQMPDGSLRVAGWVDSAGGSGEMCLSVADLRALRQYEELQSEKDALFDRARMRLRRWISVSADAPEWMRDLARTMPAWRSPARMVSLLSRWRTDRPEVSGAEAVARADIEAWADRDRHAWATVEARRIWGLRRRKDRYRCWAKEIVSRSGTIVLEKFDLRVFAERAPVGEDKAENETARSNRQLAAVSRLREALLHATRESGTVVVQVTAVDSTRTCPSCGVVEDRDAAAQVDLTCDACGHTWDQDVGGAAPVLLTRYRERPGDAKILVGAREGDNGAQQKKKGADRWARARRMGAAKQARTQAAREAAGNTAE